MSCRTLSQSNDLHFFYSNSAAFNSGSIYKSQIRKSSTFCSSDCWAKFEGSIIGNEEAAGNFSIHEKTYDWHCFSDKAPEDAKIL